jgi:hypothetical protein
VGCMSTLGRPSSFFVLLGGLALLGGCGLALGLGDFQEGPAGAGGAASSSTSTSSTSSSSSSSSGAMCSGGAMECKTKVSCGLPTECTSYDCVSDCCTTTNRPDGTVVVKGQTANDCASIVCDGNGETTSIADPTDLPVKMDDCHVATCSGMNPLQTAIAGACTLNGVAAVCGSLGSPVEGNCVECNTTADCAGGKGCIANQCAPASCKDNVKDGSETDTDCGGFCPPCTKGSTCLVQADCAPGNCVSGICGDPTCTDGVQDGTETDVDCGGSCVKKCSIGKGCAVPGDCLTGPNGAPTCSGVCGFACTSGFGDCDAVIGCETDITTPAHCGACGVACSAYCVNGKTCNDPVDIAGGYDQNCAIMTDGSVYCWGSNLEGEVGDGTSGNNRLQPVKVINLPVPAVALGADGIYLGVNPVYTANTCAVLNDGTVWCWGDNTFGELGQGNTTPYAGPVKVVGVANVAKIAVGGAHVCALTSNHQLYCWGRNGFGEVGNGTVNSPVLVPTLIQPGGAQFSTLAVSAGATFTCAVRTDNSVYCWGQNTSGQLGIGNQTQMTTPTLVPGAAGAIGITSGRFFNCTWTGTKNYCWGRNQGGELGVGQAAGSYLSVPTLVPGVPAATSIAAGDYHAMAITPTGVFGWGADGNGQLGDGLNTNIQWSAEQVFPVGSYSKLSMSETTTCGLSPTKGEQCWGSGVSGQLGNGGSMDSWVPVPVKW